VQALGAADSASVVLPLAFIGPADHNISLEFSVGDWVWLCLLHRPTQSLILGRHGKLGPKYVGPFKVLERIGMVAYHLQLPEGA
jgi:hypothetical protein